MTQVAIVKSTDENGSAVVEVTRKSACSGDCESCGACHHPEQLIQVKALNTVKARAGDRVIIESSTKKVFTSVYMTYILPIILMVGFYFIPSASSEGVKILCSLGGFALGVAICFIYSRVIAAKGDLRAEIKQILN